MALSLNKPKLDNLASDIWKSAERLRGKLKSYGYRKSLIHECVTGQRRITEAEVHAVQERAAKLARNPAQPNA